MSKFNETHNTSLKKNFALSTAYQILLIIAPFITAPYVSRVIGADGIGIHSFTDSILAYFTMFAALGTNSYASREMSRNRDDRAIMSKIFWEIMIVRVITTGICLVAWVFFILLTPTYKIFYLILTIPLFATIFDISWLYTGLEQFSHTVYRNAFFRILGIVLIFIFIRKKEDLIWYYIITAGIILPSNLTLWIPLHKFVDKPNFHNIHLRQHFKETMIYFVPSIATSIYTVLDKTLIGVITHSAAENGYYEQATKIINMTKAVTFSALNGIMVARMSYLYKEGEIIELKNRLSQSINYVLFSGIGCCFGIIAVAHRFVPVFFGKDYDQVIPIMQLLSPVIIFVGISNCLGMQYYNPARLRKQTNINIITGAIINLICNIIFIPKFHAIGAVIGTLIAECIIAFMYVSFCDKMLSFSTIIRFAWKKIIAGTSFLIILSKLDVIFQNDITALIIEIPIGILIYFIVLFILQDKIFKLIKDLISPKKQIINKSTQKIHISFDDVINIFEDITINSKKYHSAFDNPFLSYLKHLHNNYNAKFTLYCYYKNNKFSLSYCTDLFANDFQSNYSWLKFGFHATDASTTNITPNIYKSFLNEIIRITGGTSTLSNTIRLHEFKATIDEIKFIKENHSLLTLLTADNLNIHPTSYYLTQSQCDMLQNHKVFFDNINGINFIPTSFRFDDYKNFNSLYKQHSNDPTIVIFSHEWLFSTIPLRKNMIKYLQAVAKQNTIKRNIRKVISDKYTDCEFIN